MRLYRHWHKGTFRGVDAKGEPHDFEAWGWSNRSESDARSLGAKRAKNAFLYLAAQSGPSATAAAKAREYEYDLTSPPREELVRALDDEPTISPDGEPNYRAVVTRLRYGSLVLNVTDLMFVDIDVPSTPPLRLATRIKRFFSPATGRRHALEPHARIINHLVDWSARNPRYGFRLYRTKAGYRLLFTTERFSPLSRDTERILRELGSDPLYRQLTQRQQCFRARLTPKCWRIGLQPHSPIFPRALEDEPAFASWLAHYDQLSAPYATCSYIQSFGPERYADPAAEDLVTLHDHYTKSHQDLPLA